MSNEIPAGEPYVVPNSSMAVVSLVAGILGLTFLPLIGGIVAVIAGMMARKEIQESAGTLGGEGMATAGLVMGWISIGLSVLGICTLGAFFLLGIPLCVMLSEGSYLILPGLLGVLF